jgi:hypothetical protein
MTIYPLGYDCGLMKIIYALWGIKITANSANALVSSSNCDKGWHDGSCCCNCKNHYEDFNHCTTGGKNGNGGVCSEHKGWIRLISCEGETPRAHSGWSEHGMCEMHVRR